MRAALLLLLLAAARADDEPEDAEPDDDGDSAPFMIVVEHPVPSRWRCGGALVSLRTALTSAWCARGRGPAAARELWALAAAAAAAPPPEPAARRRVARVATARSTLNEEFDESDTTWGGVPFDVAVLELEAPFGAGAHARPILMATSTEECGAAGALCHVARALSRPDLSRAVLRIEDAQLANDTMCSTVAPKWEAVRDQALCLTGPQLCSSDWGAGVVCGGKLCGVLSRSAGGPRTDPNCGVTHAAQSVARWRRFLHCAHTLRTCGRGECAELCIERHLLNTEPSSETRKEPSAYTSPAPPQPSVPPPSRRTPTPAPRPLLPPPPPTRTSWPLQSPQPPQGSPASPARLPNPVTTHTLGCTASLFEPNRPDFKAGEYGDNAAEYVAPLEETAPPSATSRPTPAAQPRAAPTKPAPAPRTPAPRSAATTVYDATLLIYINILVNV